MLILFSVLFLMAFGCQKKEQHQGKAIAQVNDQVLTASEVKSWESSLGQDNVDQETRLSFIRNWVEEVLLYEEALNQDLMIDPWVNERLEEVTRQIVVSRFLQLDAAKRPRPSPREIKQYFEENNSEFIRSNLNLEVEYWRSETKEGMDKLRANLLRGKTDAIWTGTAGGLDHNRISLEGAESTDPQVWKTIIRLKEGQVSNTVIINNSNWIFKLLERCEIGEMKKLEDVEEEIIVRLSEEQRAKRREELIKSLIKNYHRDGKLFWADAANVVTLNQNPTETK